MQCAARAICGRLDPLTTCRFGSLLGGFLADKPLAVSAFSGLGFDCELEPLLCHLQKPCLVL